LGGDQQLPDGADDPECGRLVELYQGIQTVLWREGVTERGRLERDRADGARRVLLEQAVEIEGLMRPVKRTRAEVHRADVRLCAVVTGAKELLRSAMQGALAEAAQSVTPVFQMASSRSPLRSAQVGWPEAVATIRSSSAWLRSSMETPVSSVPASKSIQRGLVCARTLLLEIFRVGAGNPSGVPRPVVKSSSVAPAAARAVTEMASFPGASSSASPGRCTRSPSSSTCVSGDSPAFCTAPRDFSSSVVM